MTSRARLAWIVIVILGLVCLGVGVIDMLARASPTFEASKFVIAGLILVAIATYKIVGGSRPRR